MDEWLNRLFIYGVASATGLYSKLANSVREAPPDVWTIDNYIEAGALAVISAKFIFDIIITIIKYSERGDKK